MKKSYMKLIGIMKTKFKRDQKIDDNLCRNEESDIGQMVYSNKDNLPFGHVWIRHQDGTVSNHLFSSIELLRSSTRALQNPSLCIPLIEDFNGRT